MAYYQKKPVTVEAFCPADCPEDEAPEWWNEGIKNGTVNCLGPFHWTIKTLEGEMHLRPNDYVIKGVKGELYPCRRDIFEETYEEVIF